MKTYLLLIAVMIILVNCSDTFTDETFSFKRTAYTGNQLKIDGYYYYDYNTDSGNERRTITFFYRDGTSFFGGNIERSNLMQWEEKYANGSYYNEYKHIKQNWAIFKIEGNKIRIENWGYAELALPVTVSEGSILNDTTYKKIKINNSNANRTYHYKQFSPKPDSTNVFID